MKPYPKKEILFSKERELYIFYKKIKIYNV
jgi:hypothetical protein